MTTITFQGRTYTPEVLATMTIQELTDLHNRVASLTGGIEAIKFSDEISAQTLTWAMLSGDESPRQITRPTLPPIPWEKVTAAPKASRKKIFKFPAEKDIKPPKAGTLRHDVLEAMRRGVTYNDVINLVREFDARRGLDEKNTDRRAYEVIRLLHYYCGYGMDQSPEGVIKITG